MHHHRQLGAAAVASNALLQRAQPRSAAALDHACWGVFIMMSLHQNFFIFVFFMLFLFAIAGKVSGAFTVASLLTLLYSFFSKIQKQGCKAKDAQRLVCMLII